MDDRQVRHQIYRAFAETGNAPPRAAIETWAGRAAEAREALGRLHDAHALVLDNAGGIRMALPFSAVETDHRVVTGSRSWWANCAWDSLAIPAALGIDATIQADWLDTGEPVGLAVVDGELNSTDGFIHFVVSARHWWDDIVET
jgi:hypothetical protein